MIVRIGFRPEAESELTEARDWYRERGLGLGDEFLRAVDSCLVTIQQSPASHPVVYRDIRRALLRRFPYGIFYLFEGNAVTVLACFHAKRNPTVWKQRMTS